MSHNVSQLDIKDLHATIDGKEILKGVDFQVKQGEIHAVMGPNGSGKSTLASTVMGHPKYIVTKGDILFDNESLLKLAPDVRARKGLFLAFQYPYEVPGVSLATFLRTAYNAVRQGGKKGDLGQEMLSVLEFRKLLKHEMGVMIITHYQRILRYIKPDHVHILLDGRMVKSGGPELADVLEERGYDWIKKENL